MRNDRGGRSFLIDEENAERPCLVLLFLMSELRFPIDLDLALQGGHLIFVANFVDLKKIHHVSCRLPPKRFNRKIIDKAIFGSIILLGEFHILVFLIVASPPLSP